MIFIRLVLDQYMLRSMRDFNAFWAMAFIIALLAFPSNFVTEYGTLGLIMAIYGYLVRRKEELKETHPQHISGFFTFALLSFLAIQQIGFGFNESQFMGMCMGTMSVMGLLYFFKPATFPNVTKVLPGFFVKIIQFTGRRTLEIYVVHLLIFKFLAPIYNPEVYTFFDWSFIVKDAI
jgi:peptidoglycan/LPS O-acetylase OafA/YrhL